MLYHALDEVIGLTECDFFSHEPDIESDPHASDFSDDVKSVGDSDSSDDSGDGPFAFDDYDIDEAAPVHRPAFGGRLHALLDDDMQPVHGAASLGRFFVGLALVLLQSETQADIVRLGLGAFSGHDSGGGGHTLLLAHEGLFGCTLRIPGRGWVRAATVRCAGHLPAPRAACPSWSRAAVKASAIAGATGRSTSARSTLRSA
jgi:hypothetical protein